MCSSDLKTGARALVSVMEKALLPFEKRLPSTELRELLVTPELVAAPAAALERLLAAPDDPELAQRFAAAARTEPLELMKMISKRQSLYAQRLSSPLTPARMDLIADEYYRVGMTLGTAFEHVLAKLEQIRDFEVGFHERFGLKIRFDETAEVAILAGTAAEECGVDDYLHRLSQVLEPGLKLVHDRTSQGEFNLPQEAVLDTENYLRGLFQTHYAATLTRSGQA